MTKKLLILGTLAVATFSMPQAMMRWDDGQRESSCCKRGTWNRKSDRFYVQQDLDTAFQKDLKKSNRLSTEGDEREEFKTLGALWVFLSEKNKEKLSGLHGVLLKLFSGESEKVIYPGEESGTFEMEIRDTRTLGEDEKGYPVQVTLLFNFNGKEKEKLSYVHSVEA